MMCSSKSVSLLGSLQIGSALKSIMQLNRYIVGVIFRGFSVDCFLDAVHNGHELVFLQLTEHQDFVCR